MAELSQEEAQALVRQFLAGGGKPQDLATLHQALIDDSAVALELVSQIQEAFDNKPVARLDLVQRVQVQSRVDALILPMIKYRGIKGRLRKMMGRTKAASRVDVSPLEKPALPAQAPAVAPPAVPVPEPVAPEPEMAAAPAPLAASAAPEPVPAPELASAPAPVAVPVFAPPPPPPVTRAATPPAPPPVPADEPVQAQARGDEGREAPVDEAPPLELLADLRPRRRLVWAWALGAGALGLGLALLMMRPGPGPARPHEVPLVLPALPPAPQPTPGPMRAALPEGLSSTALPTALPPLTPRPAGAYTRP